MSYPVCVDCQEEGRDGCNVCRPPSNAVACAPTLERCGTRATHWRGDVPWMGPARLCPCCLKRWTEHYMGHLYNPIPPTLTRVMDLGCDSQVQR